MKKEDHGGRGWGEGRPPLGLGWEDSVEAGSDPLLSLSLLLLPLALSWVAHPACWMQNEAVNDPWTGDGTEGKSLEGGHVIAAEGESEGEGEGEAEGAFVASEDKAEVPGSVLVSASDDPH